MRSWDLQSIQNKIKTYYELSVTFINKYSISPTSFSELCFISRMGLETRQLNRDACLAALYQTLIRDHDEVVFAFLLSTRLFDVLSTCMSGSPISPQ
jgi:hypothetical protein